jgi:hypothetical protein
MIDKGSLRGITIPPNAPQAKERIVIAIGPKVEDLEVGDSIIGTGKMGEDVVPLPNEQDLYLTRQSNILLVIEEEGDEE